MEVQLLLNNHDLQNLVFILKDYLVLIAKPQRRPERSLAESLLRKLEKELFDTTK